MSFFEPELGQAVFSNTPWGALEMEQHVGEGIGLLGSLVSDGKWENDPTANTGAQFENDVFVLRAYCWCDGSAEGHEEGCPPNFEYKRGDFSACWYKHSERSGSQPRPMPISEWRDILIACLKSLA